MANKFRKQERKQESSPGEQEVSSNSACKRISVCFDHINQTHSVRGFLFVCFFNQLAFHPLSVWNLLRPEEFIDLWY